MKKLFALTIIGTLLGLAGAAHGFPVARLKGVRPVVQLRGARSGAAWALAREKQAISFGNTIRTGAGGRAQVLFNNGTHLAMKANTQIEIIAPPSSSKPLVVRVTGALSEVFVRARGKTEIRTAAGTAAVRGTEFLVRLPSENTTELTVAEGAVDFSNPQGAVVVAANQQSVAQVGTAPSPPVAVDASGLFAWTADVSQLPLEWDVPRAMQSDALDARMLARLDESDFATAMELFKAAPEEAQADVNAMALSGVAALYSGDAAMAEGVLRRAVGRKPDFTQARAMLALALLTQNRTGEALAEARRAAQIAPNSPQAQSTLAIALFFGGRSGEASQAAKRALAMNPLSPLALLAYGRAMMVEGNVDEAREAFGQAQAVAPALPIFHAELGAAFLRLDNPRRAEESYRAALQSNPASVASLVGLGVSLGAQGKTVEARANFEDALRRDPHNANARARFAGFLIEEGRLDEAQKMMLNSGVLSGKSTPENGAIFIRLSEISLYRQDLRGALEGAKRAVQILPDSAPAHYQLGRVLLEQDRIVQAESQFRLATILDPDNATARYALGFTRQKTERGLLAGARDILGAAALGGPGSSLTLQNLQTPGADDRIQAAVQDPTAVRVASRSYGDTQIDARIGENGVRDFDVSHLKEFGERRGVYGANLERQKTDGVRDNADRTLERGGFIFGRKKADDPSAFFLLGEVERSEYGLDTGLTSTPFAKDSRFEYKLPRVIAGLNLQSGQSSRTRFLVQASKLDSVQTDRVQAGTRQALNDDSLDFELRHDRRLGERNRFSAGVSLGRRNRDFSNRQAVPSPLALDGGTRIRATSAYIRDEMKLGERLSVIGEMQLQNLRFTKEPGRFTKPFVSVIPGKETKTSAGVPKLILSYRPDARSSYRLRVRRVLGSVTDFQLLTPNDSFLLDDANLPGAGTLNPLASGRSVELEHNRTFTDASFLRLTLFQQDLKNSDLPDGSIESVKVRGARASYEGTLGRDLAFFARSEFNSARMPNTRFAPLLPKFVGSGGLQYLNRGGLFLQSIAVYQSSRDKGDGTRLGGFGVLNLRAGVRSGLRREVFVELNNALDKSYDAFQNGAFLQGQTGRRVVLGIAQRF